MAAQQFTLSQLTKDWRNYPWFIDLSLTSKSETKISSKGQPYMETIFREGNAEIRAMVYDSDVNMQQFQNLLQVGNMYRIHNANITDWTRLRYGKFYNLCELVLPDINSITQIQTIAGQGANQEPAMNVAAPPAPSVILQEQVVPSSAKKIKIEENASSSSLNAIPSTSSSNIEEDGMFNVSTITSNLGTLPFIKNVQEEVIYIISVNQNKLGYPTCIDQSCRQKMTQLDDGLFLCPQCQIPSNVYGWNLATELTFFDGSNISVMTATGETASTILGFSADTIAEWLQTNNGPKLAEMTTNVNGKIFLATTNRKEVTGTKIPAKILSAQQIQNSPTLAQWGSTIEKLTDEKQKNLEKIAELQEQNRAIMTQNKTFEDQLKENENRNG